MRLVFRLIPSALITGIALLGAPHSLFSQEPGSGQIVASANKLPEAPQPQFALAAVEPLDEQAPYGQTQTALPSASASAQSENSASSQSPTPQTAQEKSAHDLAEEQLKAQEHQRVMGVMASFNTTRNKDAIPLSSGQKYQLFFKSATDPWPFGLAAVVAGIGQANDSYPAWGQGMRGYATRFGGAYADYFIGNFFGNAVLPSLFHEDPRYFQKGTGSAINRALWAAGSTGWCKRDNGSWGPNYANVLGNLIGAAIARVYYPVSERTVTDTVTDGLTVSAEGIVGAEVIEFWPDMVRHHRRKQAEKLARHASGNAAQGSAQSSPPDAAGEQAQPTLDQK
jgi:hypothetical protein